MRSKYLIGALIFLAAKLVADPYLKPVIEVKSGYFFFTDEKMRSVYNQGGLDLQLSSTIPVWKWLQIYSSVEYLQRHGQSLNGQQKTEIWQLPVTVGLQGCVQVTQNLYYYLAIAPRYFYVHVHNDSPFVNRNLHKNGVGGFAGTGLICEFYPHFIINLFGEYAYEKVRFHSSKENVFSRDMQVGGVVLSGGFGYIVD